ncbi:MAG: DUF1007 family protein [Hyphomicrobiales bacterium]|nr:DUF1007 family protein [Hyphomicrobiales bacterium]
MLRRLAVSLVLVVVALTVEAIAHPHVFIDARSTLIFKDGALVAVRHAWTFDDAYSAFAIQGADVNGDGEYSREELADLAKVNAESLHEYDFFTFAGEGDADVDFEQPRDYWFQLDEIGIDDYSLLTDDDRDFIRKQAGKDNTPEILRVKLLTLHMTLPLKTSFKIKERFEFDVYDPTYYVAFTFAKKDPVHLEGAPADCRASVTPPQQLDDAMASTLAAIPSDVTELPEELMVVTRELSNRIIVECGEASAAAAEAPKTATEAIEKTIAQAPPAAETPVAETPTTEAPPPAAKGGIVVRVLGFIARKQAEFYGALRDAVRRAALDGSAVWWLLGASLLYGIFHAAGPGHGKAVITSYMLANEATARRGIALAFAAAFVQATVAVLLIGIIAIVLGLTSLAIEDTARAFEIGSYALVTLLGAWLLLAKLGVVRGFGHDHAHHDHGHHEHDHHHHGHEHHDHDLVPPAEEIARPLGWSKAVAAVVSVGLRPCSGALIVLVFALSQGLFWLGVAAAYVIGIGTGLTVAALALTAVFAKSVAVRVAGADGRAGAIVHHAIEILAALAVLVLGLSLLIAALAYGGLPISGA